MCHGRPGVGKTRSAREFSSFPDLGEYAALRPIAALLGEKVARCRAVFYTVSVSNTPKTIDAVLGLNLIKLGYARLNIGLETGLNDVLAFMDKGNTADEAREALARLNEAGITFTLNLVMGLAGAGRGIENALANAAIVNEARPTLVFVSPLHVDPGARLEQLVDEGDFVECTLGDYIDEEIEFLKGLEVSDCVFFGLHVSNPIRVSGKLPRDKEYLIEELEAGRTRFPAWQLDSVPAKGSEGRMIG